MTDSSNAANPFDQFDSAQPVAASPQTDAAQALAAPAQPSGNPFDQFDGTPAPAAKVDPVAAGAAHAAAILDDAHQQAATVSDANRARLLQSLRDFGSMVKQVPGANLMGDMAGSFASTPTPAPAAAPAPDLAQFLHPGNDFTKAADHHLASAPVGLAQMAGHGITAAADALLPQGNAVRNAADTAGSNLDQAVKDRESAYQQAVPTNSASLAGATLGEVLPWATGLGELRAIGAIPEATTAAGKLASLATEGGLMGLGQPVTGNGNYASQKALQAATGALSGPALYGAGKLAAGTGSGLLDVLQRIRNPQVAADANIASLFGNDVNTLAALRTAPQYVPGDTPSAAQVLANPEAVKAERLLRNNPSSGVSFADADNASNDARQAIISQLAGTPQDMADAIANRAANAKPFIDASLTPSQPVVRWGGAAKAINTALNNPARMPTDDFAALKQARKIIGSVRGGSLQEDDAMPQLADLAASVTTKKAQAAFSNATSAIDNNMVDPSGVLKTIAAIRNGPLGVKKRIAEGLDHIAGQIQASQNTRGLVGTDILDGVRQETARILGNAKSPVPGVGTQQGVALGPVKNQIVDAIENVAPGYRDYLSQYATDSAPINTMASVRKLIDPTAPGSLNTAGDPQLAISRLRQVLRGDDNAKFPMSDDARNALDQVQQSLLRRTISNNPIAASGPATAADLQAAGGSSLGGLVFGNPLGGKAGPLTRALGSLSGGGIGAAIGGVPGALIGSTAGALLPEAAARVNAGIAERMGSTAANANDTADAILRNLARQRDPGAISKLLFGSNPQAAPQKTLNAARGDLDMALRQLRSATPANQAVNDADIQGAISRVAAQHGIPAQSLLGTP
jgi:hypothetical protein